MQRYFSNKQVDNKFILSKDDLYHINTVMRMTNNSKIEVVYNHDLFICHLDNSDIVIDYKVEDTKKINKEITLIIPVLKEAKMDLILQKATELGVNKIIPITTSRTIVKIDNKEDKKLARWLKICKEASEQSKRISIPIITNVISIKDLSEIDGLKIVCSTKKDIMSIQKVLHNNTTYDKISIVVGPEGGLSLSEEELLIKLGFIPVSLGNLIMRVETVPIYILSVLNFINME